MSFSGGLKLTDLDDHINPSQDCIIPIEKPKQPINTSEIKIEYEGEVDMGPIEYEKVNITLTDCLACSGCITSAESILVSLQSHIEVYKAIASNKTVIASISPQVISSFSAKYNTEFEIMRKILCGVLKQIGVFKVIDINIARDLMLLEAFKEFEEKSKQGDGLPIITSACPGWICYAEKSQEFIIPYISKVKSPQQIMGSLVKNFYAKENNLKYEDIYHFTIMPCYDKKLEASRNDFYNDLFKTRDIDCVITTGELEKIILEKNIDMATIVPIELDPLITNNNNNINSNNNEWEGYLYNPTKYSFSTNYSDGLTQFIYYQFAKYHFNFDANFNEFLYPNPDNNDNSNLNLMNFKINTLRNNDFKEIQLIDNNNNIQLKIAQAYGFRNIQNVIRKLKNNKIKSNYQFIEIMACPSGCINGGGQLKNELIDSKQWLYLMKKQHYLIRNNNNSVLYDPFLNPYLQLIYQQWFNSDIYNTNLEILNSFYTEYHPIKKEEKNSTTLGLSTKW
ncbi:iron hydrogenase [Neoconidiobolus thromboides FSU 785]|nr:iron hydrogenase [Neoconidiobolus thromboides FSU 785]